MVMGKDGKAMEAGTVPTTAPYIEQLGVTAQMAGDTLYRSPIHFTAAYQAASVIQLSGGFPTIYDVTQFLAVRQVSSAGVESVYYPSTNVFSWDSGTERLTVTGATFAGTDVFEVVISGADRAKSLPENAINNIQQNPSHLYGNAVEVLVQENIPISTVTRYRDVSKYRSDKAIQVVITGAGLTVKLWLTNEPGTDLTAKTYYQDGALPDLTASDYWVITYPVEALKFEFVSTVATDDVECYMSLR
jgi:hypothetical protein